VPLERVARIGPFRETVPREIEHQYASPAPERGRNLRPSAVRIAKSVQKHERAPLSELVSHVSTQARSPARLVAIADQLMRSYRELKRGVLFAICLSALPNADNFA
jgi:hypothetical protein